jgi:beta-N-acetylhexosaminidase
MLKNLTKQKIIILIIKALLLVFSIILSLLAFFYRISLIASARYFIFFSLIFLSFLIDLFYFPKILLIIRNFKDLKKKSLYPILIFFISILTLIITILPEARFQIVKQNILNTSSQEFYEYGKHFILGYRNFEDIKTLVKKKAIGGVYITAANVKGLTKEQIQKNLAELQNIRKEQGLEPLIIAADQEGGIVSQLSPPLVKKEPLSKLVEEITNVENVDLKRDEILNYAYDQAMELREIGVNLNLAPVVDLNLSTKSEIDLYSYISERAISKSPEIVAKVSEIYCEGLKKYDVNCTLKHFPGLGAVNADTHLFSGELNLSLDELEKREFIPFFNMCQKYPNPFAIMVSHTKLTKVDPENPASVSQKVISEIIRKKCNNILITDDFSMLPISLRSGGVGKASFDALNNGIDYVLISYDTDLYFESINYLLEHKLDSEKLQVSDQRIFKFTSQSL